MLPVTSTLDSQGMPKKTYMRRSLTMNNPPVIKSGADGQVYKMTGRKKDLDYVRPIGRVYTAPNKVQYKNAWDKLSPFKDTMAKALKNKGLAMPDNLADAGQLFYNQIVAAKGFNGTKPQNFEAIDNADTITAVPVVDNLMTYFKSLLNGQQPNGQPLASQDQKIANDVKGVVQDLRIKAANLGLSPTDAAAAGVNMVNTPPVPEPFYKKPMFKWIAIAAVVLVVIVFIK